MSAFSTRVDTFLDEFLALHPHWATSIGDHRYDDRWPDVTDAGRRERLAFADRWLAELGAADHGLTPDERIDRDLLIGELEALRFAEDVLRQDAWDPLDWVYLLGFGLFPLTAREFAPLAERLASLAGRLESVDAVLAGAREVIGRHPARPVSRLHAETAIRRLPGIGSIARDAVAQAEAAATGDPDVAAVLPRLRAAQAAADEAVGRFGAWLDSEVLPRAEGEGLLGDELFRAKLRHTLRDPTVTPERLLERAETEFRAVRAEMVRIARQAWPQWCPGRSMPDDDGRLVRDVLDAIALEHVGPDELLDECRRELARVEAFVRERELIGLANDPLEIRWTPEFLRSFGGAMLDSPGPLDRGQKAFFAVTPVREEWTPEEVESYLRENNTRQARLLVIHEAVPGHYLQFVYANRVPSIVRAAFASGLFAEGWAVYVTQVMMDEGYGDGDLALWLSHWKFYLRVVTNAIIDVRIHTRGMTTDEAVRFMVEGGFQEEAEAKAKDERARLSSTQLSTYFIGSLGMWDLEAEARRRAAIATGAGADAVPAPRVVGGYGPTPGFRYRDHLEAVISHGAPPIPLVRRILFGDA
ncbi:MAG TPA: DUF885 domain-containing protein [Candidatus Limnocylindrales bacterium]|nr:DUF885 domain-containing protein [Candidatus Limnocylindrales bacterium]